MEIKLNAGDKITIPTGCKATIEDDLIIIEEKQEEFKDGDILHSKLTASVVIFKNYGDNSMDSFRIHYSNRNGGDLSWMTSSFRHATEEEKQAFFDELKAKGLHWNPEAKKMERIRERAKKGKSYLHIDEYGVICEMVEQERTFDNNNYNSGNYYRISEIAQAEEDAKAIRAIFEKRLKVK
jgi:hypothetical protein|nr:MAG TPA: hypothetical protein [Caudoviricetes sp.]